MQAPLRTEWPTRQRVLLRVRDFMATLLPRTLAQALRGGLIARSPGPTMRTGQAACGPYAGPSALEWPAPSPRKGAWIGVRKNQSQRRKNESSTSQFLTSSDGRSKSDVELRPMRDAVGQPQNVGSNRTLEARGSTPLSATRNPVGEPRRGLVFLGVESGLWTGCGPP